MVKSYRNKSKTNKKPTNPWEKERIDQEIQLCGLYGLKNKKELWRIELMLARFRKRARTLLTLEENNERRLFEGQALLRKMFKYGLLNPETENKLDYVLAITVKKLLNRRLQTIVYKTQELKSNHQARMYIRQRHFTVNKQLVNVPSFMVTVQSEQNIHYHPSSRLQEDNKEKKGRSARRNLNRRGKGGGDN